MTDETWYDDGKNIVNEISYDYDLADRLTLAADDWATNNLTYYPAGQLKTEDNFGTPGMTQIELTYEYDPIHLESVSDDLGGQVIYDFSPRGRLDGVQLAVGGVVASATLEYTAQNWQLGTTINGIHVSLIDDVKPWSRWRSRFRIGTMSILPVFVTWEKKRKLRSHGDSKIARRKPNAMTFRAALCRIPKFATSPQNTRRCRQKPRN